MMIYCSNYIEIICDDVLKALATLEAGRFQTCITSPPYWGLRDYGVDGQLGLEATLDEYVENMVKVFRGVRRVLRDDGTLWLNLGDSYTDGGRGGDTGRSGLQGSTETQDESKRARSASFRRDRRPREDDPHKGDAGLKPKNLIGIPWHVAFALQADGWYLRSDIIWHKPNPMPESVIDRPTRAHEYVFLLTKSARYYYDADAIREPSTQPCECPVHEAHGRDIREIKSTDCWVLDPFCGSGTVGIVALNHGRRFAGIDLNEEYLRTMALPRLQSAEDEPMIQELFQ